MFPKAMERARNFFNQLKQQPEILETMKLEHFLNSKEMINIFGEYDLGIDIRNYMSGCYISTNSDIGYNIQLNKYSNDKEPHQVIIEYNNNLTTNYCKNEKQIIDTIKKIIGIA